jgi:hypothetical protein
MTGAGWADVGTLVWTIAAHPTFGDRSMTTGKFGFQPNFVSNRVPRTLS